MASPDETIYQWLTLESTTLMMNVLTNQGLHELPQGGTFFLHGQWMVLFLPGARGNSDVEIINTATLPAK